MRRNVALADLTTLRLGGPADELVEIESEAELEAAVRSNESRPILVLGGGSNLVVGDDGFRGVVLHMRARGVQVVRRDGGVAVDVAAGEPWNGLVARAVAEGWSGVESLAGIPGSTGATPMQNVGAYGQQVSDTIDSVRVYDREMRTWREFANADCGFAYRDSMFKRMAGRFIVTRVRFTLDASDVARAGYAELARALGVPVGGVAPLRAVHDAVLRLRAAKGMVVSPDDPESVSAGSFFMNPTVTAALADDVERRASEQGALLAAESMPRYPAPEGQTKLSAAWLIERAGFPRGTSFGHFRVSAKHSLALVHAGGGTTRELLDAAMKVRAAVRERFGVTLTPEPVMVGCVWPERA